MTEKKTTFITLLYLFGLLHRFIGICGTKSNLQGKPADSCHYFAGQKHWNKICYLTKNMSYLSFNLIYVLFLRLNINCLASITFRYFI